MTLKARVRAWLEWAGFTFDPFLHLDAAGDPRLVEYLVGHDAFARVWGDHFAWVFAPAGGGQTALRISVERACWVGYETNHPFPIPYIPPFLEWGHTTPSLEEHIDAIVSSAAWTLLLALAYRPHWMLRLTEPEREQVRRVLGWNLPAPLETYLAPCVEAGTPDALRDRVAPTFPVHGRVDANLFLQWIEAMKPRSHLPPCPSPTKRWEEMQRVLLDILGFSAVYVLADGFDATFETAMVAEHLVNSLDPLMKYVEAWAGKDVYLKGFLPYDTHTLMSARYATLIVPDHVVIIRWTPAGLAEIVRRRVYVATEGMFGSLDAVATSDVRDAEILLAREVVPLPREMLLIARRVIEEHVEKGSVESPLTLADIRAAIAWYAAEGKLLRMAAPLSEQ